MNPNKTDFAARSITQKQDEVVWLLFQEEFNVREVSAETIASMFSEFGDFYIFKDTR